MLENHAQGALEVIWELEECLKEITGMDAFSLQLSAGSQCELLGVMIAKKYFAEKNENRTKIIIPDSAQEKPAEGEVVSVGNGAIDEKGNRMPMDVKAGDRILFGKWSGTEVKINGEDMLIMKESDILGIMA
jgi:chaperonin GroES